jgi:hypothetical protein
MDSVRMVCIDCLLAVANNDTTGIGSEEREREVLAGVARIGIAAVGDYENDETFSKDACECCGTRLHGSRHEVLVLDGGTIPCSWCGRPVYDDEVNAHVHSGQIMCDDQKGKSE